MKKGGLLSFNNNNIILLFWLHLFLFIKIIFSVNCFLLQTKNAASSGVAFLCIFKQEEFFSLLSDFVSCCCYNVSIAVYIVPYFFL